MPDPAPVADLRPDFAETIRDRYVIERELGRGGMATVVLAHEWRIGDQNSVLAPMLAKVRGEAKLNRPPAGACRAHSTVARQSAMT